MRKNILVFFAFFAALVALATTQPASAAVLYSGSGAGSTTHLTIGNASRWIGEIITPTSTLNISTTTFGIYTGYAYCNNTHGEILDLGTSTIPTGWGWNGWSWTSVATSTNYISYGSSGGLQAGSYSYSSASLAAGHHYLVAVTGSSDCNGMGLWGSSGAANTYSADRGVGGIIQDDQVANLWGEFDGTAGPPPPPPPSITLSFPSNGSTIPDFSNWVVSFTSILDAGKVEVDYGYLSSSTFQFSDTADYSTYVSANPLPVTKSQSLFYPPLAPGITWYAKTTLTGATTTYSSPIMSFSINPSAPAPTASTSTNLAGPFSTMAGGETSSTLATPTTNCQYTSSTFLSDPVGNIQQGICQALVFLFVPNTAQQSDLSTSFNSLTASVGKKPPFGYFTLATNAFKSFSEGSSTNTLVSSSTYTAFSSVFTPLKTGMGVLLIVMFGFWLVHWVTKLDL